MRRLLKTTIDRYPDLQAHLVANHPWESPEVAAVPVVTGSPEYLDWIRRTTTDEHR